MPGTRLHPLAAGPRGLGTPPPSTLVHDYVAAAPTALGLRWQGVGMGFVFSLVSRIASCRALAQ
jgi:hypothetical protein